MFFLADRFPAQQTNVRAGSPNKPAPAETGGVPSASTSQHQPSTSVASTSSSRPQASPSLAAADSRAADRPTVLSCSSTTRRVLLYGLLNSDHNHDDHDCLSKYHPPSGPGGLKRDGRGQERAKAKGGLLLLSEKRLVSCRPHSPALLPVLSRLPSRYE